MSGINVSLLRSILHNVPRISIASSLVVRGSSPLWNSFIINKRYFSDALAQSSTTEESVVEPEKSEVSTKVDNEFNVDIHNDESFNGFVNSLINIIDSNNNSKADDTAKENVKMFLTDPVIRKIYNECKHTYYKQQGLDQSQPLPTSFNSEFLKMCQLESILNPSETESDKHSQQNSNKFIKSNYHVHTLSRPEIDIQKEIDFENLTKDFEFIKKEDSEEVPIISDLIDTSHLKDIEDKTKFNQNNKVVHDIIYAYKYLIDQVRSTYSMNGDEEINEEEKVENLQKEPIQYNEIIEELAKENKDHPRTHATGRRKESTAVVTLTKGNGSILINKRLLYEYFQQPETRENVVLPFFYVKEDITKYDIKVSVFGGGVTGQAEAIRLAISKLLASKSEENYEILKAADMLYRDPRTVERKKPGRRKARKPQQWVKR